MSDLPIQGKKTYLGDGLYVSFDGFQLILTAPRIDGTHFIALEPAVWQALTGWINQYPRLRRYIGAQAQCTKSE